MKNLIYITLAALILMTACKKDEDDDVVVPEEKTFQDLKATLGPGMHYTLFSFRTGDTVAISDSATTKWDIGFRSTSVILNGGTSGPGNAGALLKNVPFDSVTIADPTGYIQDNGATLAVPSGSGNGWYNYNGMTHVISPVAGRTFIIRTADNKFAKLEFLSYYQGAPANPTLSTPSGYYTFRYAYQGEGRVLGD